MPRQHSSTPKIKTGVLDLLGERMVTKRRGPSRQSPRPSALRRHAVLVLCMFIAPLRERHFLNYVNRGRIDAGGARPNYNRRRDQLGWIEAQISGAHSPAGWSIWNGLSQDHKRFLAETFPARRDQFKLLSDRKPPSGSSSPALIRAWFPDLILGTGPGDLFISRTPAQRGAH